MVLDDNAIMGKEVEEKMHEKFIDNKNMCMIIEIEIIYKTVMRSLFM
jgi:hypothetical protein